MAYVEKTADVLVGSVAENRNARADFGGSFPYGVSAIRAQM
jgi:hypothetical protein